MSMEGVQESKVDRKRMAERALDPGRLRREGVVGDG